MNICCVWFRSQGLASGVPQPRYMNSGSLNDPALRTRVSAMATRRTATRISGLLANAAVSSSARVIAGVGGVDGRECRCSCASRPVTPDHGSADNRSAPAAGSLAKLRAPLQAISRQILKSGAFIAPPYMFDKKRLISRWIGGEEVCPLHFALPARQGGARPHLGKESDLDSQNGITAGRRFGRWSMKKREVGAHGYRRQSS